MPVREIDRRQADSKAVFGSSFHPISRGTVEVLSRRVALPAGGGCAPNGRSLGRVPLARNAGTRTTAESGRDRGAGLDARLLRLHGSWVLRHPPIRSV